MTIKDVKKAINNVLISNNRVVYSSETDEGFKKPAYFVNIYPVSIQKTNSFFEEVQLSVELQYEPLIETAEHCIDETVQISNWFSVPINVEDRNLTVYDLDFDIDETVLYVYFNINYMQTSLSKDEDPDLENMKILKLRRG